MRGSKETIELPGGHSFRVLRWERNLRDVDCVLDPGLTSRVPGEGLHWHFHTEMELTLFTSGEGTRFIGDHIGPFSAGDLVLLGEKLPHFWHTRGDSSGFSMQWHFPESHPFWAFPENLEFSELFLVAGRGVRISGRTAAEIGKHFRELPDCTGPARLAHLISCLAWIAHAPEAERTLLSDRAFNLSLENQYQSLISRAVQHLVANFRDEVRIEELLRITDMSRATFSRQFKKHAGRTFSEFLNHLRLQAACRDLQMTDRNVLEIALASGFTQISFFNRLFRREFGCSPRAYRVRPAGSASVAKCA
jgi:AraC-like DNA-binding protein